MSEADIKAEYTMLNKHLRINELLHEYSRWSEITKLIKTILMFVCFSDAQMIFLTLPQQKPGKTKAGLFMAAIDVMTRWPWCSC